MQDVVTPQYERQSAKGVCVFSPMFQLVDTRASEANNPWVVTTKASCSSTSMIKYQHFYGYGVQLWNFPEHLYLGGDQENDMMSEALTKALANAREPDLSAMVEVAEANKTFATIATCTMRLYAFIRRIISSPHYRGWLLDELRKEERWRDKWDHREAHVNETILRWHAHQFVNVSRYVSSFWLMYRYEVQPLYATAAEAWNLFVEKVPKPERETFRSSVADEDSDEVTSYVEGGYFGVTRTDVRHVRVTAKAGTLTELVHDSVYSKVGLSLSDVAPAAWELTRFSFIVDWFVNIGDNIQAHQPTVGRRTLGSWVTLTSVHGLSWSTSSVWRGNSAVNTYSFGSASGSATLIRKSRRTDVRPSFQLKTLDYRKFDLYARRMVDAISLLAVLTRANIGPMPRIPVKPTE